MEKDLSSEIGVRRYFKPLVVDYTALLPSTLKLEQLVTWIENLEGISPEDKLACIQSFTNNDEITKGLAELIRYTYQARADGRMTEVLQAIFPLLSILERLIDE